MIDFIEGRIGGGKTYTGVQMIVDWLNDEDDGVVVTNLALNVEALAIGLAPRLVRGRIRILTNDEAKYFWRYIMGRKGPIDLPFKETDWFDPEKGVVRKRNEVDFSAVDTAPRQLFVIDEVQTMFGARQWQERGPEMLFWVTQLRKLGQRLICICPRWDTVETQLVMSANHYWRCHNMAMSRVLGFWKGPQSMVVRHFDHYPSPGDEPDRTIMQAVNKKTIGSYYFSAQGVGRLSTPRMLRDDKNAGGWPIWTLPFVVAVGAILASLFLFGGWTWVRNKYLGGAPKAQRAEVSQVSTNVEVVNAPGREFIGNSQLPTNRFDMQMRGPISSPVHAAKLDIKPNDPEAWKQLVEGDRITGIQKVGSAFKVYFSGGVAIEARDVTERWGGAWVHGQFYKWKAETPVVFSQPLAQEPVEITHSEDYADPGPTVVSRARGRAIGRNARLRQAELDAQQ